MIDKKLLARINELAKKEKEIGLSPVEREEQKKLRQEYLSVFREGFKEKLMSVKVVDPKGNDITPDKLKKAKNERNSN